MRFQMTSKMMVTKRKRKKNQPPWKQSPWNHHLRCHLRNLHKLLKAITLNLNLTGNLEGEFGIQSLQQALTVVMGIIQLPKVQITITSIKVCTGNGYRSDDEVVGIFPKIPKLARFDLFFMSMSKHYTEKTFNVNVHKILDISNLSLIHI